MVEDVVLFQTVEPYNRRKDLQNAITFNIPKLLSVAEAYLEKNFNDQIPSSAISNILPALEFVSSLLEWIPGKFLTETKIVVFLTKFLVCSHDELRQKAAEALWRLTERKGKSEERVPSMQLFEMNAMQMILVAAK